MKINGTVVIGGLATSFMIFMCYKDCAYRPRPTSKSTTTATRLNGALPLSNGGPGVDSPAEQPKQLTLTELQACSRSAHVIDYDELHRKNEEEKRLREQKAMESNIPSATKDVLVGQIVYAPYVDSDGGGNVFANRQTNVQMNPDSSNPIALKRVQGGFLIACDTRGMTVFKTSESLSGWSIPAGASCLSSSRFDLAGDPLCCYAVCFYAAKPFRNR